jgi:glutathione S-transferase
MPGELVLYTNPMSRGRIARWMLEEIGAPYRTEIIEYGPAMKSPEYLAVNPMGKVPALRHGDVVVTECAAICAYLADAFPEARMAPAPADRASYYRWLFFAAGPIEAAITNRSLGVELDGMAQARAGYGSFTAVMDALSHAVQGRPFIAGERFSAADVYVGSQIGWGLQFGTVEQRPEFTAYWSRIRDRPAHRRATELDDALMAPPAQQDAGP